MTLTFDPRLFSPEERRHFIRLGYRPIPRKEWERVGSGEGEGERRMG